MVSLSPRFAVLAAFVATASLVSSPLSVGAVAIPRAVDNSNVARFIEPMQRAFSLSQAKAMKRDYIADCDDYDLICLYLGGTETTVLRRSHHSSHWQMKKKGSSYLISQKPHHSSSRSHSHRRDGYVVRRGEQKEESGTIDIISPSSDGGKTLGHLYMEKKPEGTQPAEKDAQQAAPSYPVGASPTESTTFRLVRGPRVASADGQEPVKIKAPTADGQPEMCMGYETGSNSELSIAPCNESGTGKRSENFGYDEKTRNITPLQTPSDPSNSAQGVLARDEAKDVVLRFVPQPQMANVADIAGPSEVAPSNATSSTSTMTTTVTVTSTPTASLAAADVAVTSTANVTSSTAVASTSTANGSTPTGTPAGADGTPGAAGPAGAAGIMEVQVVQPSNSTSVMSNSSSTAASAVPTTTMNAQDVASSIAGSSTAASVTSTPTVSATGSPYTGASSVGSVPSSAPSARAVSPDPYKWVFRRE